MFGGVQTLFSTTPSAKVRELLPWKPARFHTNPWWWPVQAFGRFPRRLLCCGNKGQQVLLHRQWTNWCFNPCNSLTHPMPAAGGRGGRFGYPKQMVFRKLNPSKMFISRDSIQEQLRDSSLQSTSLRSKCSRSERSCCFSAMFRLLAWRTKNIGERTTMLAALPNGMLNPMENQRSRDTTLLPRISKKTCVDSIDQGCPQLLVPPVFCLTLHFAVAKPRYVI